MAGGKPGRPKNNPIENLNQKEVETEVDVQALIEEKIKEVTDKYENKIKELEESLNSKTVELENVELENKPIKKSYKFIPDYTKIRIQSNVDGKFLFQEDRGKIRVFIQLDNFEDSAVISYEELRTFYSSKPNFIKKGKIIVTDVYSDEDIELEDVLIDLRLDKIYGNDDIIDPRTIKDMLTDKVNEKEFMNLINATPDMAETVVEVAYIFYRKGHFNDNAKMNFLRQIFGNQNLFK